MFILNVHRTLCKIILLLLLQREKCSVLQLLIVVNFLSKIEAKLTLLLLLTYQTLNTKYLLEMYAKQTPNVASGISRQLVFHLDKFDKKNTWLFHVYSYLLYRQVHV